MSAAYRGSVPPPGWSDGVGADSSDSSADLHTARRRLPAATAALSAADRRLADRSVRDVSVRADVAGPQPRPAAAAGVAVVTTAGRRARTGTEVDGARPQLIITVIMFIRINILNMLLLDVE